MDLKKNKKYKVETENPRLYQIRVLGITLKSENLKFEINFPAVPVSMVLPVKPF